MQPPKCVIERAAGQKDYDWLAVIERLATRGRKYLLAVYVEVHA